MKNLLRKVISCCLISVSALSLVAFTPIEQKQTSISQIIAFGDSASDNGAAYATSKAILELPYAVEGAYQKPGPDGIYWENRYSNGKTAVEVLAEMADKKLTNYATGGGTSGYENYSDWMDILGYTGVLGQINKFEKELGNDMADPNALYFIFAGGNDYFKFVDYGVGGTAEKVGEQVAANMEKAVRRLAALGAKNFFIPASLNPSDLAVETSTEKISDSQAFKNRLSELLPTALTELAKELNVTITQFNVGDVTAAIYANPQAYGLVHLDTPAQPTYPEILPVKENVDQYMFWDEWHYTRVTHRILGESMFGTYKEIK